MLVDLMSFEKLSVVSKGKETLHLDVSGIKVTFLGYHYPVLFPFESFLGTSVADPRDIACMKISAIAGRGARRDFIDLYETARHYGLADLMDLFRRKYALVDYNFVHILKSLTYFKDAETEPMPQMLLPISWQEVTEFFTHETIGLV